jgi:hydrogenase maturation factor
MEVGKFPAALLERMLAKIVTQDSRVVVGPRVGEDAAVIDMGEKLLVAKSDPITFATNRIGWYAVQVNANDVACTGGTPRWFMVTLLVPERFSEAESEEIFNQTLEACQALGITLVGGHSEVTYGIDRPIVLGSMLGEVDRGHLIRTSGAQEGDSIVLTKGIAIEGTALLAREQREQLLKAGVIPETIDKAATFLTCPGISVIKEAHIAVTSARVHCLHDPTEGGLVTGLREIAWASGLGLAVEEGSIPVLPECQVICDALGLNPLGLLASGALLITLPAADVPGLLATLEREGIDGWEIGQMIAPEEGLVKIGYQGEVPLPDFSRDEVARYFSTIRKSGIL